MESLILLKPDSLGWMLFSAVMFCLWMWLRKRRVESKARRSCYLDDAEKVIKEQIDRTNDDFDEKEKARVAKIMTKLSASKRRKRTR